MVRAPGRDDSPCLRRSWPIHLIRIAWKTQYLHLRTAFQASVVGVGLSSFNRIDRGPRETTITQRRQAAKGRVQIFAAWRLCVRPFQQVRQRTCRTATSEANPRKRRLDEFRCAFPSRLGCQAMAFTEPVEESLSTNHTNRFIAARLDVLVGQRDDSAGARQTGASEM